jgi:hypothetical protein
VVVPYCQACGSAITDASRLYFFVGTQISHLSSDSNPNSGGTNMRIIVTAATFAALLAVPAFAVQNNSTTAPGYNSSATAPSDQTSAGTTRSDSGPSNPAIKTNPGNNAGAPASGANSFTMGQAKARIESRGYVQVSELKKDKDGLWRGTAMKDGKPVNVALDYQGNVVTE